jgi:hypothetical protein
LPHQVTTTAANTSYAARSQNREGGGKIFSSNFLLAATLCCCCVIAYYPTFFNNFQMLWDDQWVMMNDYTEGGFTTENISSILTEFYHGQYAPVNELFYLTLYTLFGYNAFAFHTASLLVHIANVLLVYFLLKKVLHSSQQFTTVSVWRIAFMAALLMAVHPFLVEAVAWVAASKCILFALFYLIALHCYVNYLITNKWLYFWLTLLFFIISFGAKEQAVTMPVCLLLFDYALNRHLKSEQVWFEKLPFFCLSVSFAIITFYSQAANGEGLLSAQKHYPFYQNIVLGAYTVTEYIIKCVLPVRLSYIYPFPYLPGQAMPVKLWLYPVVLVVAAAGFYKFWCRPWVLFGMGFFIIQITVVANIIPTARFAIVADRYVYLPAIGIFFLIAHLLNEALQNQYKHKKIFLLGTGIYIFCLSVYARQRTKVWHSSNTLKKEMEQTIKGRSDYKAWQQKNEMPQ